MPQTKLSSAKVYKESLFKVVDSCRFLQVKSGSLMTKRDIFDRVDEILTTQSEYILVGEDTYSARSLPPSAGFIYETHSCRFRSNGWSSNTITVNQIKAYTWKGVFHTLLTT